MVQPLEKVPPGEESLIERPHHFWIRRTRRGSNATGKSAGFLMDVVGVTHTGDGGASGGELVIFNFCPVELGNSSSESMSANRSSSLTSDLISGLTSAPGIVSVPATSAIVISWSAASLSWELPFSVDVSWVMASMVEISATADGLASAFEGSSGETE